VPGLCYRYFESKQVLYDTAIEQYVKDITLPMIELLKEKDGSLDGFLDKMEQLFLQSDGREKYHHFFHKKENHGLQMLMSVKLCETIEPYMQEKLQEMNEMGITRVGNIPLTASYMLFGAVPVLENDALSSAEKAAGIRMIMKRILGPGIS
jgi:AcrR family transcriptional regulator